MHFARTSIHGLALVAFAFTVAACSSSSKAAPVITGFDAPDSVAASQVNGQPAYVLSGNLDFSDSAEDVVSFTAHLNPVAGSTVTIEDSTVSFPTPTETGPLAIQLGVPADPAGKNGLAPGSVSYTITVHSVSGIASAPLSKTVTLQ